ncbi:MAG: D-threitol dehydrogenase [Oscillospiraceae bacterium]|jgi:NAD(P)-dependent dehydrogenase (short-subunit alcohol dehydrogenase family)|nr:D-threitol dehydrogenase [Oscillospiraceae bacterium]
MAIAYKKVDGTFDLTGKTALITGGANGIGRACADMLAAHGAGIVLVDILDKVHSAAAEIQSAAKGKVKGYVCDITQFAAVQDMLDEAVGTFGGIDILCNVAGAVELADAEVLPEEYWDKLMLLNAKATFMMSQKVGNIMIKNGGGKIVNISSQAGFIALDKHLAYTASKAAVIGMTKVLAYEWAEFNINVNSVAPTVVLTELGEKAWQGQAGEDMKKQIPAGRFCYPDEVAAAVYFLSSDGANMITGETLVIDGGFTIK